MTYALDTDTVSYAIRGEGNVGHALRALPPESIRLPSIVMWEACGWRDHPRTSRAMRIQIDSFLTVLPVIPFDERSAHIAAEVRRALRASGSLIGAFDMLVAGTAMAHGLTLVTHNARDFSRVPGLSVEDWY